MQRSLKASLIASVLGVSMERNSTWCSTSGLSFRVSLSTKITSFEKDEEFFFGLGRVEPALDRWRVGIRIESRKPPISPVEARVEEEETELAEA